MPRPGITQEQVSEAADALLREGKSPSVIHVRDHLGTGSPNTITRFLAQWKEHNAHQQPDVLPAMPEPVESVMRQVWGVAWREAEGKLDDEREALAAIRQEIEQDTAQHRDRPPGCAPCRRR